MNPEIKYITVHDPEYTGMLTLRDDVLRKPLGMSIYQDDLQKDEADVLIVAVADQKVIGCAMLKKQNDITGKLRQMAVSDDWQGTGLGRMIVRATEKAGLEKGYESIELNARETAIPFYEKLGYQTDGPTFTEVGIPHKLMKKQLL
jgi:predicted GNAT family N-acyltransferase